jgi:hypothetical protein
MSGRRIRFIPSTIKGTVKEDGTLVKKARSDFRKVETGIEGGVASYDLDRREREKILRYTVYLETELFQERERVELVVFHFNFLNETPRIWLKRGRQVVHGEWFDWISDLAPAIDARRGEFPKQFRFYCREERKEQKVAMFPFFLEQYRRFKEGSHVTVPMLLSFQTVNVVSDLIVALQEFRNFDDFKSRTDRLSYQEVKSSVRPKFECEKVHAREGIRIVPREEIDLKETVKIDGECWDRSYLLDLLGQGETEELFQGTVDIESTVETVSLLDAFSRLQLKRFLSYKKVFFPLPHFYEEHMTYYDTLSDPLKRDVRNYVSGSGMGINHSRHSSISVLSETQHAMYTRLTEMLNTLPPILTQDKFAYRGIRAPGKMSSLCQPTPFSTSLSKKVSEGFAGPVCCLFKFGLEGFRGLIISRLPEQALEEGEKAGTRAISYYEHEYEVIAFPGVATVIGEERSGGRANVYQVALNQYIDVYVLAHKSRQYQWFTLESASRDSIEYLMEQLKSADKAVQMVRKGEYHNKAIGTSDLEDLLKEALSK